MCGLDAWSILVGLELGGVVVAQAATNFNFRIQDGTEQKFSSRFSASLAFRIRQHRIMSDVQSEVWTSLFSLGSLLNLAM